MTIIPRVALVTGTSSGIGRATAALLVQNGFRTFGTIRGDAAPQAYVQQVRLDVRDPDSVERAVNSIGRIDVLVNSAGTSLIGALEETSLAEARELFETNFFGVVRMTQAVLPAMRAQRAGRIITISSVLGFLPAPFMSIYAATKHAIEGWSESLDHEVRGFGIHAVTVEPAFTRTELGRNSLAAGRRLPEYEQERERVAARVAQNIERGVDPDVVADVVMRAVAARSPRLRYQAGSEAKSLHVLRSIAPSALVDQGIRKAFAL